MPDVVIRHLRLRIIRTGSLFWGADPRSLARRALAALPELLAEELGRLGVGEHGSLDLPAPLRLSLRGTSAGLAGALAGAECSGELRSAIRAALEEALASASLPTSDATAEPVEAAGDVPPPRSVMGLLLRLHLAGELPARLREMETGLLLAFHRLLLLDPAPPTDPPLRPATAAELEEGERVIAALLAGFAYHRERVDPEERVRERITAAMVIAAQIGVAPYDRGVRLLLDGLVPMDAAVVHLGRLAPPSESPPATAQGAHVPEPPFQASQAIKSPPVSKVEPNSDQTASILPLLAAVWLARNGDLARVAGHLDRMNRGQEFSLWIAGLAFKLSPPPERGWIYKEKTWRAVAAIADSPLLSGQELVRLADDPGGNWKGLTFAMLGEDNEIEMDAFLLARPACALARTPEFNQHISLVVRWVLGMIAGMLWPEAPNPIAASFERLMSLEVSIRRTEEGLAVRVPLGKRRDDLIRAGLLNDVYPAPWLHDSGSVRFHGG